MQKVLIAAICVFVILIGIIAVDAVMAKTKDTKEDDADGDISTTQVTEISSKDSGAEVQFSMPLYYLEEKYRNDLDLFCRENNYTACTVDEQSQTFTVTMNALAHDMMLINVGIQSIKNIANSIESQAYPFFKELKGYNDDFSEITVAVDKNSYPAETNTREAFKAFIAGCGIYYQLYTTENSYACKVIVKDAETQDILDEQLFQQSNSVAAS